MKKLNKSILRKINYCIGFILSLLGVSFTGCSTVEYGCPPIQCEYGVPSADYQISGRVENAQKQGIQGIKVYMKSAMDYDYDTFGGNPYTTDTTTTDGAFKINYIGFPEQEIWLIAEDIDSTENGHYKTDTIYISPNYERDPNNSWNQIANIDNVVITLEEKEK